MKNFFWLFITGIFFWLLVVERVETKRFGVAVSDLKREVDLKETRNQYLRFEIAKMSAPEVLYREAEEKLGLRLTKPQNIQIIKVSDEK